MVPIKNKNHAGAAGFVKFIKPFGMVALVAAVAVLLFGRVVMAQDGEPQTPRPAASPSTPFSRYWMKPGPTCWRAARPSPR